MAAIALTTPYSLKNSTLAVAADDFTEAISQVRFNPSTSASTWRGIGGNVLKDQTIADWSAVIGFAQDLAPTGFLRYLMEHEGEEKEVVFTPVAEGPAITATLILSPGGIGGAADGNFATTEVTLAVQGKPAFSV